MRSPRASIDHAAARNASEDAVTVSIATLQGALHIEPLPQTANSHAADAAFIAHLEHCVSEVTKAWEAFRFEIRESLSHIEGEQQDIVSRYAADIEFLKLQLVECKKESRSLDSNFQGFDLRLGRLENEQSTMKNSLDSLQISTPAPVSAATGIELESTTSKHIGRSVGVQTSASITVSVPPRIMATLRFLSRNGEGSWSPSLSSPSLAQVKRSLGHLGQWRTFVRGVVRERTLLVYGIYGISLAFCIYAVDRHSDSYPVCRLLMRKQRMHTRLYHLFFLSIFHLFLYR